MDFDLEEIIDALNPLFVALLHHLVELFVIGFGIYEEFCLNTFQLLGLLPLGVNLSMREHMYTFLPYCLISSGRT